MSYSYNKRKKAKRTISFWQLKREKERERSLFRKLKEEGENASSKNFS